MKREFVHRKFIKKEAFCNARAWKPTSNSFTGVDHSISSALTLLSSPILDGYVIVVYANQAFSKKHRRWRDHTPDGTPTNLG